VSTNPINPRPESNTRLTGRWLIAARAVWLTLATLTVVIFIAAAPARLEELRADPFKFAEGLKQMGLSIEFFAWYGTGLDIAVALAFALLGGIIFSRKSEDGIGILTSLTLVTFAISTIPLASVLYQAQPTWRVPLFVMRFIGYTLGCNFLYLFPDGRFVPRWTRALVVVISASILIWFLIPGFTPPTAFTDLNTPADLAFFVWVLIVTGSAVATQIYRYRRVSGPIERQQTKWVVLGLTAMFVGFAIAVVPILAIPALRSPGRANLLYILFAIPATLFSLLLLPLSIAISILRYRLFDIDLIIRRTLVYTVLTGALGLVYFGSVVVLQQVFRALTGQAQSPLVTVVSTLAIAALFTPLRRRIQRAIDRRLYRRKYGAAQTLAAFAATARDEVELEKLMARLVAVVEETMQPESVGLWLVSRKTRETR
jgi:hypothetical protein